VSDETTTITARGLAVLARLVPLADDVMCVVARGYIGGNVDLQFNAPESVDAFRAAVPAAWAEVGDGEQYRWSVVLDGVEVTAVCVDRPNTESEA
jgi:hypothetical protein